MNKEYLTKIIREIGIISTISLMYDIIIENRDIYESEKFKSILLELIDKYYGA